MKTGKSLIDLANEIQRQANCKRDFIVSEQNLTMTKNGHFNIKLDELNQEFGITDYAHGQIASRLDIPKGYYDRMKSESPELLLDNVNHWLKKSNDRRMVRTLDGSARAFLSNRFRTLDNIDLAEAVLPKIQESGASIESCDITDKKMYLKTIFPKFEGNIEVGDPVQFGLSISNSEVGAGSVKIEPLIYRLVCRNGMIVADSSVKKYHITKAWEELGEILRNQTIDTMNRAFWMQVRDLIDASLSKEFFEKTIDNMKRAKGQVIVGDPVKSIEVLAKTVGLKEGEKGGVLQHLIKGGDLSQYGLLNAVTRYSQDVDSYDRATELEQIGGEILELPRHTWDSIAVAV